MAAGSPEAFLDDRPTAVLIRQVLGAVAQFEKAMVVSKLSPRWFGIGSRVATLATS
jgi:hypothetical protein